MVPGRLVTEGTSTLGGRVLNTTQTPRLLSQFRIGANSFSVVLIGENGGEKLRVNDVPDLQAIYAESGLTSAEFVEAELAVVSWRSAGPVAGRGRTTTSRRVHRAGRGRTGRPAAARWGVEPVIRDAVVGRPRR